MLTNGSKLMQRNLPQHNIVSDSFNDFNGMKLEHDDTPRHNISSDLDFEFNSDFSSMALPADDDPDLFDPNSDPSKPVSITVKDVIRARENIGSAVNVTPCLRSRISESLGMELYLKFENRHRTNSFKERGARNVLEQLTEAEAKRGVVAASAGNHAQALAYHGGLMKIPVLVVMPLIAPEVKIQSCRRFGAEIFLLGKDLDEAKQYALKIAKMNNMTYINGYDHPLILAGQGTVGLEIMQQVPDVDAVIVPCGGGGLISGVAVAVKHTNPKVEVIGIGAIECDAFAASMRAGKAIYVRTNPTVADGLAVPMPGHNAVSIASQLVDRVISVEEGLIQRSMLTLVEQEKCIAEGGGATALAGLLSGQLSDLAGKRVVAIVSGGNVDTPVLIRTLERALVHDCRLCKFTVMISDRPNGLPQLCQLIGELGVNIRKITHQRPWTHACAYKTEVTVECEFINLEQKEILYKQLKKTYASINFSTVKIEG